MKSSATATARLFFVGFVAMSLVLLTACSEERKVSNKAEWLCTYDQLQRLDPDWIPDGTELADYVHPTELEYLRQILRRDRTDNPDYKEDELATLSAEARQHLISARADQTRCRTEQIQLFDDNDIAIVELHQNKPEIELSASQIEEATPEELETLVAQSSRRTRSTHTLLFLRTDDGWRADMGLKERAIEFELNDLDERQQEIEQELPRAKQAAQEEEKLHSLSMFRVQSASLDITDRRQRWGDLELEVVVRATNRSEEPIGRIDFEVTYRAPGQKAKKGEFFYDDLPIRSGETREISLSPTDSDAPFGDGEFVLDDNASLDVSVLRLYDRRDNVIAETGGPDSRRARESLEQAAQSAQRLEREMEEMEKRRHELRESLSQWRKERFSDIDERQLDLRDLDIYVEGLEL